MSPQPEQTLTHCIFEYYYCDAGNWSTGGALLLTGNATDAANSAIAKTLEYSGSFVAEQIGVPSLCPKHFAGCGATGPDDMDHAYHTFERLRAATQEEISSLPVFDSLDALVGRFFATHGRWDVRLSPNVPQW